MPIGDIIIESIDSGRDMTPLERSADPLHGMVRHPRAHVGTTQQGLRPLRDRLRIAWRNKESRLSVDHGVLDPPNRGSDHGRSAGHGFQGRNAEGFVPGRRNERIGRAVVLPQPVAATSADERDGLTDAGSGRDGAQLTEVRRRDFVRFVAFTADDHEPNRNAMLVSEPRERAHHIIDSLAWYHAPELQQEGVRGVVADRHAGRLAIERTEALAIDAARHHPQSIRPRVIQGNQIRGILRALGDDRVGFGDETLFNAAPRRRKSIGVLLMEQSHTAEGVEGDDERNRDGNAQQGSGDRRRPEVRVQHIVASSVALHEVVHPLRERRHVRQQLFFWHNRRRTRLDVDDAHPGGPVDDRRRPRVFAAGEDVDGRAARRETLSQFRDVDVLATGIDSAQERERRCVLTDHGDALHANLSAAWTTSSTDTPAAHSCAVGHTSYEQGRQATGDHRTSCRSRSSGAQRGTSDPEAMTTLGVPSAAATCETPVSLQTRMLARSITAASTSSVVRPARSTAWFVIERRTAFVSAISPPDPVSTIAYPRAANVSATEAKRRGSHRRDDNRAPGWMQT